MVDDFQWKVSGVVKEYFVLKDTQSSGRCQTNIQSPENAFGARKIPNHPPQRRRECFYQSWDSNNLPCFCKLGIA
jgi:hypothetical protein